MYSFSLTLFFLSAPLLANAGSSNKGDPCTQGENRLQVGTYQFWSNCNSQTYCAANSTCVAKGCRNDDFPFGYPKDSQRIPDKCRKGQFCPDEEDACQPLLAVGSACQFNRDDQCEAPPNFKDLADTQGLGLNFNGSVCLNNVCMWANRTAGQDCAIENTAYIAYESSGEFVNIVSRGNCRIGLYCDSQVKKCMLNKAVGDACAADKECDSWNCLGSGVCGVSGSTPRHFPSWVYVIVALGIIGSMVGTLVGLFFAHRKQRDRERSKRTQYWREQNAFHQNLLHMREQAQASILSLPGNGNSARSTLYGDRASDESHAPILSNAAPKGSGLRHYLADDGSSDFEESYTQPSKKVEGRF